MKKLVLACILLSILTSTTALGVTVTRYVDPGAGGANNGTSWGDAYTSLNAWDAAEAEDITAGGSSEVHICNCKTTAGADATAVNMTGWTTDATYTITIQVATADRHDGTRGTGYRLVMSDNFAAAFSCAEDYVTIDGIVTSNTHADGTFGIYYSGNHYVIKNCLTYDNSDQGVGTYNAGTDGLVENCISYGNTIDGFFLGTSNCYHCTSCANGGDGIRVAGFRTVTAKNCYAGGNTGSDYSADTNGTLNTTTCHDADGTADTTTAYSADPDAGTRFTNIGAGTEDLTVVDAGSALNENTTGAVSATDFEGDTRDGTNPYAGADELVAAAAGGQVIIITSSMGYGLGGFGLVLVWGLIQKLRKRKQR